MKSTTWAGLLSLLGKEGAQIMLRMILSCGIFISVDAGRDNYYQLCGMHHASFIGEGFNTTVRKAFD